MLVLVVLRLLCCGYQIGRARSEASGANAAHGGAEPRVRRGGAMHTPGLHRYHSASNRVVSSEWRFCAGTVDATSG